MSASRLNESAPLIVLGAPRSGTNLLRDLLCRLPGRVTWPCDELNYLWRHGHRSLPHDELTADQATPQAQCFVRRAFARLAARRDAAQVVEKTCANTLRVPFVDRILPEARYVVLVRDGRDAAASAVRRWTAGLNLAYLARKARFVPLADLPYYALHYAWRRLQRLWTRERRVGSWGPRFAGLDDWLHRRSLPEVCAAQWQRCVETADAGLANIDPVRVCRVRYETLVAQPAEELCRLADFLQLDLSPAAARLLVTDVSPDRIAASRGALDPADQAAVESLLRPTLARLGYLPSAVRDDGEAPA